MKCPREGQECSKVCFVRIKVGPPPIGDTMNILVSDSLSPKGVEVLERAGFSVDVKTKLTKEELLQETPK